MTLKEIYSPVENELDDVVRSLEYFLSQSENKLILEINQFLLSNPGKRLRPAMVLLSAKAGSNNDIFHNNNLIKVASAIEMIHWASLVHDDVIDHSLIRHNKPSVNQKWGLEVSVALGDYLYSKAFELLASCRNMDMLYYISKVTSTMCIGELTQVRVRKNVSLMKQQYLSIIEKKTASLFSASCKVGAMLSNCEELVQSSLKDYGLNFGIAYQIIDDCIDLVGDRDDLGKPPGADFKVGELTLPIINLLAFYENKKELLHLISQRNDQDAFQIVKDRFIESKKVVNKTKEDIQTYIQRAKESLININNSVFKQSLISLTDFLIERLVF